MNKNIFILGDLMVDHTVFVADPTNPHQIAVGEIVFEVIRRQSNAGGAANSARILALINSGTTYLWGVLGQTRWGSFRDILEASLLFDGAPKNIELRGAVDETGATMNTITRLVQMENNRFIRRVRYDDTGHIHVTAEKLRSVLFHMKRINEKTPLDAIVINDLDKGAVNKALIEEIYQFASSEEIPIFVDPKRDRKKYDQIQGTAILPNLEEWCYLVNRPSELSRFQKGLDNKIVLNDMAQLSFRYLGNFKYHIITCDKQGSLLMFPDPHARNNYCVYHAPAVLNKPTIVDSPLGSGDILTAVFAAHYDKNVNKKNFVDASTMVMEAFQAAHEAAGAYCSMPWHQMPSLRDIQHLEKQDLVWREKPKVQVSGVLQFLPKDSQIDLKPYLTSIPQMYSKSKQLCDELARLVKDINENHNHHFLVGAPSGFGKSIIIKNLHQVLDDTDTVCINGNELSSLANSDHDNIQRLFEGDQFKNKFRLVLVDEAYHEDIFKKGAQGKPLLILMDKMLHMNLRFVFFDSHFYRRETKQIDLMSDINSRCGEYEFESILYRPMDIPLLLASAVVNSPEMNKYTTIRISGKVLLFAASEIIEDGNSRRAMDCIKMACEQAEMRGDATIEASDYPCSENNIVVPNGLIEKYYVILHK